MQICCQLLLRLPLLRIPKIQVTSLIILLMIHHKGKTRPLNHAQEAINLAQEMQLNRESLKYGM